MRVSSIAPVIALDLDGTLADYYKHFHWFAEIYLQRPLNVDWQRRYKGEFSEALGLEKHVYRDIKMAYRQGGMKRSIPEIEGAGDLVRFIRSQGIQVWICTTRPWRRLDNIDPDTMFWVDNKLGKVDGVIYGEDKYLDLIEQVGKNRILGVVDDLPENIEKADGLGLNWLMMGGHHNMWWQEGKPELRVIDFPFNVRHFAMKWKEDFDKKQKKGKK